MSSPLLWIWKESKFSKRGSNVIVVNRIRPNKSISQQSAKPFYRKHRLLCTISLKGIVQRKGPVALPYSGRNRTIWLSRVYASPEPFITIGKFGVVGIVWDSQASGGSDRGSSPVGSKIFLLEKKKPCHFSAFPFPHKELPDCRHYVTSLTFKMESREIIIFVDSNQAMRSQHTMHPASLMRQLAIAQWLVRPAINLHNITPFS